MEDISAAFNYQVSVLSLPLPLPVFLSLLHLMNLYRILNKLFFSVISTSQIVALTPSVTNIVCINNYIQASQLQETIRNTDDDALREAANQQLQSLRSAHSLVLDPRRRNIYDEEGEQVQRERVRYNVSLLSKYNSRPVYI